VAIDRSISVDILFQMPIRKGIESGMNTSPSIKVAPTRSQKLAYRNRGGGGVHVPGSEGDHVPGSEGDHGASGRGGIGCPSMVATGYGLHDRFSTIQARLIAGRWPTTTGERRSS
jgi:hypothetical protein